MLRRHSKRSNLDSSLAKDPHDLRAPDQRVLVHVLMPVDEKPGLCPLDVAIERLEADVNLRVALVHAPGRIVGHENVHGRETGQQSLDFLLLVQVVPPWLLAPRSVEAAEAHPVHGLDPEVQVGDRRRKRPSAVMVAFDGKNVAALCQLRRFQNYEVSYIADRDHYVGGLHGEVLANPVIVGEHKKSHGWTGASAV
jgi:hypothetical protein